MKKMRRLLSALLAVAVMLSLAPAVLAQDGTGSGIALSEPTPERVFCAVNYVTDAGLGLQTKEMLLPVMDAEGNFVLYSELVLEDGTLTPTLKQLILEMSGEYTEEDLEQVLDVYDFLYMISESLYMLLSMFSEDFARAYPTTLKFYDNFIIGKVFGGEEYPPVADVMDFVFSGMLFTDEEGYAMYAYSNAMTDAEGYPIWLLDEMDPNGAYVNVDNYGYKNVYLQLADARENDMLDAYQAFEILTGYAPDASGDLMTSTYIETELLSKNEEKVKLTEDLVNDDLTVGNTGLSAREFALSVLRDTYNVDFGALLGDVLPEEAASELEGYFPVYTDEMLEAELDSWIDMLKEYGEASTDREVAVALVDYVVSYDYRGFIVSSSYMGYAYDGEGKVVNIADVMDENGNFLTDEFGAENVWALLDEYIAGMDTDVNRKGDVNGDGKINLSDASAALKHIAGWENIQANVTAADTSGDGRVNLADVSILLKYIANWDVYFQY